MSAELCKLVGFFLVDGLKNIFGLKRVGLYRDDGIAVLSNSSGFKVEKLKKKPMHSSNPLGHDSPWNHHL